MKNKVICISREYGSSGDEIAYLLGEQLHIPVYEKNSYWEIYLSRGMRLGEPKKVNMRVENILVLSRDYEIPLTAFQIQSQEIIRLASKSDCIILGRCADWILQECDVSMLRVFITASTEECIRYLREHGETSNVRAKRKVRQINLLRKDYYETYTHQPWGAANQYDLYIDQSEIGMGHAVRMIANRFCQL